MRKKDKYNAYQMYHSTNKEQESMSLPPYERDPTWSLKWNQKIYTNKSEIKNQNKLNLEEDIIKFPHPSDRPLRVPHRHVVICILFTNTRTTHAKTTHQTHTYMQKINNKEITDQFFARTYVEDEAYLKLKAKVQLWNEYIEFYMIARCRILQ